MTTLNTIIEEEKNRFDKSFSYIDGHNSFGELDEVKQFMFDAMQRAYEAGADAEREKLVKLNRTCGCTLGWCTECLKWKGVIELAVVSRDTYWKERVREVVENIALDFVGDSEQTRKQILKALEDKE